MTLTKIIETGTYTGNAATQSISIGWQPAMVLIASARVGGPQAGRAFSVKMPDMPDDDYLAVSTESIMQTANGISLVADGFDVGSDSKINNNTDAFHWIAIRAGPEVDSGFMEGDLFPPVVVSTGRQPVAIFHIRITGPGPNAENRIWIRIRPAPATEAFQFTTFPFEGGGLAEVADGFEATGAAAANTHDFTWTALYDFVGSTRHFETGTFTGANEASITITLGRQPKFVILYGDVNTEFGMKTITMGANDMGALEWQGARYAWDTSGNGITLTATGFIVGTTFTALDTDYFWLAGYE